MYKPIEIDKENLTILGVAFPDMETFNSAAGAIGSNMYEGFMPTKKRIALIRDYVTNQITFAQFVQSAAMWKY
ncbi:MAG: antitoxin VbhA family protein [Prevotellaceae bacterium]|jgi:putative transcriptional regulator|nr:antitoxin VbhA family protein [Prevotellaceae bacterium]